MTILHYEVVAGAGVTPTHWLALTHGIFGSGGNWRSIARKFLDAAPTWGAVLIDLRGHGKSPSGTAPHTLAACALDLAETLNQLRDQGMQVEALTAHSFGGKVALALSGIASDRLTPLHRFILDSTPSARPHAWHPPLHSVPTVLALLESLPATWASRDAFVAAVVDAGQPLAIAQWLGLSVHRVEDQYALRLDLAVVRALLDDYFAQDFWSYLVDDRAPIDFVVARRGKTVSDADLARLQVLPAHVQTVVLDAGHWLHVDAPGPLVAHLVARLPV
ncbi:MAG: alpha/beta fold hydrolase [Kofleriaceae bacterium]|nr:alpha/beta fold hydrolase [Kofleriaceae bacterium]